MKKAWAGDPSDPRLKICCFTFRPGRTTRCGKRATGPCGDTVLRRAQGTASILSGFHFLGPSSARGSGFPSSVLAPSSVALVSTSFLLLLVRHLLLLAWHLSLVTIFFLESFIVTSSDGLQPNSDGLHLDSSFHKKIVIHKVWVEVSCWSINHPKKGSFPSKQRSNDVQRAMSDGIYDSAGNPACYFATSRPAGWPNSGRPAGWP